MNIDIWSDIACPFCYLGKVQFDSALQNFPHKDHIVVTYHSFELDPDAPRDYKGDMYDMLAEKKELPHDHVQQMVDSIVERAAQAGLTYNMKRAIMTNTHDAHRLAHYAREQGRQASMIDALYRAYFTDGIHIGDHDALTKLAGTIGLDKQAVTKLLASDEYTNDVQRDIDQAKMLGITGVPFIVINQKYGVSGAQGETVFTEALQKAWHEEHPIQMVGDDDTATCTDKACVA